ncbi:heme ABC exporter ATP-binding protein CcmA [Lentibacter algarum]|uniref:heme ABC exporter ATP-binding protein CcmA n=1 Tax=Lentibacter algarum TaxID=576131 RepID=UPI001C092EFD|nr:heme ABC exporter ATP-binding protein CcmA [Lentibacter algarum]MBU2982690.1 heme ABC exporter ATP-binding protein CcmA [Lentibacter algarum]
MELRVENLTVSRGGLPLLQGVRFCVASGQALILRGPNGIGKTTLLRTVAGLQPAVSGDVSVDLDEVCYAAHLDGLKTTLSVEENLRFWADVFGTDDVETALERLNLNELRTRHAGTLSSGQKRRLGLARLLVTGRMIWILDEPTVSLDAASVALFADVVRAHLARGGIALLTTHIELGLEDAQVLELNPFEAKGGANDSADEAFL